MRTKTYKIVFFSKKIFQDLSPYLVEIYNAYLNLTKEGFCKEYIKIEEVDKDPCQNKLDFIKHYSDNHKNAIENCYSVLFIDLDNAPCLPSKKIDFENLDKFNLNYAFFTEGNKNKDFFMFVLNIPMENKYSWFRGKFEHFNQTFMHEVYHDECED